MPNILFPRLVSSVQMDLYGEFLMKIDLYYGFTIIMISFSAHSYNVPCVNIYPITTIVSASPVHMQQCWSSAAAMHAWELVVYVSICAVRVSHSHWLHCQVSMARMSSAETETRSRFSCSSPASTASAAIALCIPVRFWRCLHHDGLWLSGKKN